MNSISCYKPSDSELRCKCLPIPFTDQLKVGPCFTEIEGNQCIGALTGVKCTRALCCATLGEAWGLPCERCQENPHPCRRGYIYIAREENCQGIVL